LPPESPSSHCPASSSRHAITRVGRLCVCLRFVSPRLCVSQPRNGRNFEYLSGEDPYLGYTLVQSAVRGIQSQGVIANAKHWVLNNQETNRMGVYDIAAERVRFEMYYPPFAGAIKAGVGSIMCSYNKVAGDK
jgi:beta-glucosidase